jgi:OmpA family
MKRLEFHIAPYAYAHAREPGGHEFESFELVGEAELLDEAEAMALVEELFAIEDEAELDLFLGKLVKRVGRAASGAARAVSKAARALPLRDIGNVAFKALRGDVAGLLVPLLPASLRKTVEAFSTDPFARFALQTTKAALRGDNVLRAAQVAAKAGIANVQERMRFAAMVAPFVPGVGSGVAAALGAASALAGGAPITEALISAARSAVPGGAIAQAAFDIGANLARGKSLSEAALATARNQMPGGPAAKAAFDAAVALAQGRKIQDAAFAAAGRALPKSPFAADALSFAKRVAAGEDIRKAALSTAGNAVLGRLQQQGVNVLGAAQRGVAPRGLAREAELFELLPLGEAEAEAEFETGRARTRAAPTTVLPTLTISVKPFVVLDRFVHKVNTLPPRHGAIVERIARLIVASRLSRQPLTTIRLVGHTDSTGPKPFNVTLGKQRAQAVETQLRAAIVGLGPVPAGSLNIVVQSLGETKPVATNATAAGRELNRRVEVFLDTTCHSFFAQYDLRFLPGDPVFGLPAYPNLNAAQKAQRSADVGAMVGELLARRDARTSAALAGRIPAPKALPRGALRSSALRLSAGQLALFREYFDDGRGGIEFGAFQRCFERFANGELRSPIAADRAKGVGEPNGDFFFLFAEFAFLCIASRIEPALWTKALRAFVKAQEIFMHVYRPAAVSPPPAVGAPLPACPLDAQRRRRARRGLSSYRNANFRATGASPTVGAGQSSPARKRALAAKYASANLAVLQRAAQANLLRAQCMP